MTYKAALDGIRIVDFSQQMAGPACTMLLADFGAEVIKVEPLEGEGSRRWGVARFGEGGQFSGLFVALNRNKASVTIDLKTPEGQNAVRQLLETADVVLENYRPGVADRIGVGFEQVKQIKPDIIYCSISGFGQTGPLRDRSGLDMLLQAYAGHMSITGEEGRSSIRTGTSPIDLLTGAHAAYAIMLALRVREQTGAGQQIDTSLYDTAVHMVSHYIGDYTGGGDVPAKIGPYFAFLAPYGMFWGRDREFYLGPDSRSFAPFCKAIGRADLIDNPLFLTNLDRLRNRDELHAALIPLFATQDAQYWVDICMKLGIPTSLVETLPEVIAQPQAAARDLVIPTGYDQVKVAGIPIKLSKTPGTIRRQAPKLGGDNATYIKPAATAEVR
jgi:crotonobetainyl-CoA:carnitine CoA-transferase CaiB-like acyl-CoA transferase